MDSTHQPLDGEADPAKDPITVRQTTSCLTVRAVVGFAYPPAGRRKRTLVIVEHCAFCGGAHHHYSQFQVLDFGLRAAGCGRGEYYLMSVVDHH